MPNHLAHSTSPYLQQHAHQPVDWYPWGEVALAKALQEDKPILLSIGYAACHWCHVMAKTSFEDALVAALMNTHFVCIKVDREERPDVDRVYVAALQAMGLPVGWPLHAFLLPNQQPFYGGLYFAPDAWKQVLSAVAQAFRRHRPHLEATAGQLTATLQAQCSPVLPSQSVDFTHQDAQKSFQQIYTQLDLVHGGLQGAPKFPMPSVGNFLLHYHELTGDERALAQLHCTLAHMASGGLYDQLGGGFARYTTDATWRIPHFEKMLCDNGLLLSLYAQTQAISPNARYLRVIRETVDFLVQTMLHPEGAFYSALDADSEGVEGKFYTWTLAEVEDVLGPLAPSFTAYFNITAAGNWQQGANVLYTTAGSEPTAQIEASRQQLHQVRMRRQPPARDEQIITAWNAMVLQGLVDAYWAVDERDWLDLALRNARFIEQYLLQGHRLWHSCRYCSMKRALRNAKSIPSHSYTAQKASTKPCSTVAFHAV
ncbi:MAG: thioredoxin domain-containing protein, partial [Bacteroidota bacterium]